VAQVGRISGPLLFNNLERQGTTNNPSLENLSFKNTNSDTTLLKINVNDGRIGVDVEAPANELHVSDTTRTTDLIGDTASVANFNIANNRIDSNNGPIYLNAGEHIQATNLETEQFYISDNYILTHSTNTDIDLKFNGTGILDIKSNLEVFGNMHATGNVTFDGNVTFGDANTDNVTFSADVQADIIPDLTDTYNLGSLNYNWSEIHTELVNGQLITTGNVNIDNMFLDSRQGNIFFVAKGGDNTNVGDHPQGPLLTIEEAISRCDASTAGPVTIYVFPGEYEEVCPLEVPANVSIVGLDIRNVVIKPTTATNDQDIFLLNDSCNITELCIKDFYYDSINNTGHAFRFAPNAVITNRSPYIKNVTVITKGSTITVDDPRGFASGDAGRGAYIDGADLNSSSVEASMLFHAATFITPGVDTINMTNGVRVEWLNSFTYFANRGLYAFNGLTGRTTYDGSTVEYGAELRSIGSANVYGNYGAVADGSDTLMYLIQHNMAYIGSGKYSDNDSSRAIYANETLELNSGKIHHVTTDHLGGFRIGDNFWIDFETGNTTISIDTLTVNQFNALRVNTGISTTVIDGAFIDTGNLNIVNNTIQSNSGDVNIAAGTGQINLQDNVNITGNLDIVGNFSYGGSLNVKGDELNDALVFNAEIEQNFNPHQDSQFNLGSFANRWLIAHLSRVEAGDISIYDNIIETNTSNSNLELRASGTGEVYIPNSLQINNNLTVSGTTTVNNNVSITDPSFAYVGDINQTGGNFTVSGDATINQNFTVNASAQFEEILIDDNFITTTSSNADLELRAAGTGIVNLQTSVNVENNLTANDTTANNVTINLNVVADNSNIGNVEFNDNYIETTSADSNLILSADRDIIVTGTDVSITPNLTVQGITNLQGTTITGTITHSGNTVQTGNVTQLGEWTNSNIYIEDNFITTTESNSNLELRASGTGEILIPNNNVQINNELTVQGVTDLQNTTITGSLTHTGDRTQTGNYTQGGELTVDSVYFEDNFITTTSGNLNLGATGDINVDTNNVDIAQDLTVSGLANLQGTSITGTVTHVGDKNQTGNYTIAGEISNGNILIEDNFITTTTSNSNLELRASGTGNILVSDSTQINNNLTVVGTTDLQSTTITGTLTHIGDRNITPGDYVPVGYVVQTGVYGWATDTSTNTNTLTYDSVVVATFVGLQTSYTVGSDVYNKGSLSDINGNIQTFRIEKAGDLKLSDAAQFTQSGDLDITGQANFQGDVQFTDVNISDNVITTTIGNNDLDLRASGTGQVLIDGTNLRVSQDLFSASITTTDINVAQDLVLDEINITDSNIEINDNYITTSISNSNLELRATGDVVFQNNTIFDNNLIVNGITDLQSGIITGNLVHNGTRTQTGNYTLIGNLNINSLVTDQAFQFDDIKIHGNVLETTLSNSNLELRASGTGEIIFNENLHVYNNLTTNTFNVNAIFVDDNVDLDTIELSTDIQFFDNVITTTNSNSNLELRANGTGSIYLQDIEVQGNTLGTTATPDSTLTDITLAPTENLNITSTTSLLIPRGTDLQRSGNNGDIRFNTDSNLFEGTSNGGIKHFNGVYSTDRRTSVLAHPTNDTIRLTANTVLTGTISNTGIALNGLQVDDILFDNATVTTNVTNSDLELERDGVGEVVISNSNISIVGNTIKNNTTKGIVNFANTDYGYVKFNSTNGVVIPFGGTATQPDPATNPIPIGDTRYNTDTQILETWDGNTYLSAMGPNPPISQAEFDDLLLEYTIIFG